MRTTLTIALLVWLLAIPMHLQAHNGGHDGRIRVRTWHYADKRVPTMDILLAAISKTTLATAIINVNYTRS